MNNTMNKVIGVVAALALVLGVVAYTKTPSQIVGSNGEKGERGVQGVQGVQGEKGEKGDKGDRGPAGQSAQVLGAVSSPDFYFPVNVFQGVTFSNTLATTSTGAGTLTYGDIKDKTTILSTNAGALTLTMPASTTLNAFVPRAGDRVSMIIVNQGTALLTLAGGTGTLLQTASSTKAVNIGGSARLDFVRKTNSDIIVNMGAAI